MIFLLSISTLVFTSSASAKYVLGTRGGIGCPDGYEVLTDLEECKNVVGELTWNGPNQSGQLAFGSSGCRPDWIATRGCFTNKFFYENNNAPAGRHVYFNTCPGASTPSHHQPICKRDSASTDEWQCTLQAYCKGNWQLADGTGDYQIRNTKGIGGVDINGDGNFDWNDKATADFWATESWPVPDECKALCLQEDNCHGVTWHGNPYFGTSQCVTCTGNDQSLNDPSVNPHSRWQYCKRPAVTGPASSIPTKAPTKNPTADPTKEPSTNPTVNPTKEPTRNPTANPTKEPSMSPTLNPTANPSPFPTAADFIIKIKAFHGTPVDILDSNKVQSQPDVDVDLYSFEQKITPIIGDRRLLSSNQE